MMKGSSRSVPSRPPLLNMRARPRLPHSSNGPCLSVFTNSRASTGGQPVCALLWLSLWRPLLRASARIRAVLPRPLAVNCWLRALLGQLSSAPRADAISPLPRIDIVHLRAFGASDRPMLARWMASPAIGIARQTHSLHLISQRQASPSRRDSLLRVPHTYRQRCRSAPVVS